APSRFSTNTGWPSASPSFAATMRLMVSIELPGAFGTSIFTARLGKSWARAAPQANANSTDGKNLSISLLLVAWCRSSLVGPRQVKHVLGYIAEHEIGRNRRDLVEARLAELALDV